MLAVRDVQITVEVAAADAAPDASRPVQTHAVPDALQVQGDRGEVVKWHVQTVLLAARLDVAPRALETVQEQHPVAVEDVVPLAPLTARLCALQLAVVTALDVMVHAKDHALIRVVHFVVQDVKLIAQVLAKINVVEIVGQHVVRVVEELVVIHVLVPVQTLALAVEEPVHPVVRPVLGVLAVAVLAHLVARHVLERVPDHVLVAMTYVRHPVRHPVQDVMAVRLAETLVEVDAVLHVRILARNPVVMDAKTSVVDAALRALPHAARIAEILVRELVTVRHPHQFIKKERKIMMKLVLKNQEEINVNYMNNVYSFMEDAPENERDHLSLSILEAGTDADVEKMKTSINAPGNNKNFKLVYTGGEKTFEGWLIASICEEIAYGRRNIIINLQKA